MNLELSNDLLMVVVLDISGIYAQIYDQGYFCKESVDDIFQQYKNQEHWRVLVI